jgi:NAD(P)-dependent dehydrogenase (short-subunit alcohol dehydrogenase family)
MRDTSIAGDIEKAAKAENLSIEIVQLDVTDDASVQRATAEVLSKVEQIDVLVNNAGFGFHGPVEEANPDEARLMFETNFFGPLRLIQAVLPGMRERRSGTIVNVSSLSGVLAEPYNGIYAASKHALEAMSESLYYESHPFNVRVLIIEPGGHDTRGYWRSREERRFSENSPHFEYGNRFMEAVTKQLPGADKPGDPQVVAEAIYNAVYTDEPKLRYMVGEEAQVARLRRQLDDAEFEQAMRTTLDIWD